MSDLAHLAPPRPTSPQANPYPYLALRPTSYIGNEVGEEVGRQPNHYKQPRPRPLLDAPHA